ncbi:MAG: type II secretion system F family protein [Xanthomonadales bacterium]|nr:MAG: type II secretion system F family protein [Dokdonella sp.]MBC6943398.1 type II secretion system F family protein [Xanthomonadales bacterium]MDL1870127.1 type II secretion system F family protein [Gammaproteobacteria bacterium PRO6]
MATSTAVATKARNATAQRGKARAQVSQMQVYTWVGIDKRGTKIRGEQISKNANLVKADLRKQGINPQVVKAKPKPLFGSAGKSIKGRDIAVFSRQLATMMAAGVPMVQGFEIVAGGQSNPRMKDMLTNIKTDIEGGSALNEALGKYPVQFDELYTNLVKAGESAGVLDTVLDTIATYKENIENIKGKIKKAMFYPAAIIAVAVIVSAILLIFVIPQFEQVFRSMNADLPAFTQMLVSVSRWMVSYWWMALLVLIGAVTAFILVYRRSTSFQHFIGRMTLKIPIVGEILRQSAMARFARTLGVTFKAGVPLVEALDSVANATGSVVYNEAVRRIREDVSVGHQLQLAMKQTNLFPNMVTQMVAIGEEAGALDAMLFKIAEFYETEVNNAVDALSSLLEPLIMVIIGGLVGSMVVGMYLPIFKLGSVVG